MQLNKQLNINLLYWRFGTPVGYLNPIKMHVVANRKLNVCNCIQVVISNELN